MSKLIVANLKMYMDYKKTLEYVDKVDKNIVVCPSYIHIPFFLNKVKLGAQDCFIYKTGAYTGYVSAFQLKELGVNYVIIGHSERREVESDELIKEKIKSALENDLKVILCIGENRGEDRKEKLEYQIENDLRDIDLNNVIIAYEPIWAIGTGITPTMKEIKDTMAFIKELILKNYNAKVNVLYGGSVDVSNIKELNEIDNVDGFLVGSASTSYEKINQIYKMTN